MIGANVHLSDDRLVEVCFDGVPDPRERHHLDQCVVCQERHAAIGRLLTEVSDTLATEADAAFTAERLGRQKARIQKRLEHEGRPARVIAFPAGQLHEPALSRARPGMRWIAGAAAVGLLVGVLAGHLAHDFSITRPASQPATIAAARPSTDEGALQAIPTTMSEEEFLGRIETAIEGSGSVALQPLDDLTPRVWEVAAR